MKCPYCKGEVNTDQKYCGSCGRENAWYVEKKKPIDETYTIDEDEYKTEEKTATKEPKEDVNSSNNVSTNTTNFGSSNSKPNFEYSHQAYVKEPIGLSVCALIFGLLGGWLGLVLGIVALSKNKDPGNRTRAIIGIVAWACWMIVYIVYGI